MAATDTVRARIDAELKREATAVLSAMGLSVSDAIRLMLVRTVAEQTLPFEVRIPNERTQAALQAAGQGDVARFDDVAGLMADLNDGED